MAECEAIKKYTRSNSNNRYLELVENMKFIEQELSREDLLIQLSEECSELIQVIMKELRHKSKNLPKDTHAEIKQNLQEELADVELLIMMVEDYFDKQEITNNIDHKAKRWVNRLKGNWNE